MMRRSSYVELARIGYTRTAEDGKIYERALVREKEAKRLPRATR